MSNVIIILSVAYIVVAVFSVFGITVLLHRRRRSVQEGFTSTTRNINISVFVSYHKRLGQLMCVANTRSPIQQRQFKYKYTLNLRSMLLSVVEVLMLHTPSASVISITFHNHDVDR